MKILCGFRNEVGYGNPLIFSMELMNYMVQKVTELYITKIYVYNPIGNIVEVDKTSKKRVAIFS